MDDAAKMFECGADLACRRAPRWGEMWKGDVNFAVPQPTPDSPNKRTGANGDELLWLFDRSKDVGPALGWIQWLAEQPFTQNESMTPEDTYRALHAHYHQHFAGVARARGNSAAETAAKKLAKSHFFWLLAGRGLGPARRVTNNHHGAVNGCVIYGDGETTSSMRFIACGGMRGWKRYDSVNSDFMFTMHDALGTIVCQGLDEVYPGSRQWAQRDILSGAIDRFGGRAWCLTDADFQLAKDFAAQPANPERARLLLPFLLPCQLPYWIDRYEDGSVVAILLDNGPSSTDPKMLSGWLADGRTVAASCSDGMRSSKENQHVVEDDISYRVRMDSGSREVVVPKPQSRLAYRFENLPNLAGIVFHGPGGTPSPQPPGEVLYLGTHPDYPRSQIVGTRDAATGAHMFEIHGDPASGIARRWIIEPV